MTISTKQIVQSLVLFLLCVGLVASVVYVYVIIRTEQYDTSLQLFTRLCNRKLVETIQQLNGGMTIITALNQYVRLVTSPTEAEWDMTARQLINRTDWQVSVLSELRYYPDPSLSPIPPLDIPPEDGVPFNVSDSLVIVNSYGSNPVYEAFGLDYYSEINRYNMIQEARRARDIRIVRVISVDQFRSLIIFQPTFIDGVFAGGIAGLYQEDLIIPDQYADGIRFRMSLNEESVVESDDFDASEIFVTLPFTIQNSVIDFACATKSSKPVTAEVILGLGLFLAITVPAVIFYSARQVRLNKRRNQNQLRFEQETAQAKLNEQAALNNANMRSAFLANVSHEIRTPLNGITGMTEFLLHSKLTPAQLDYVETIRSCTGALLSVVNDVLDYSKSESHNIILENIPCNIIQVMNTVISMFSQRNEYTNNRVIFEHSEPEIWCMSDPARLHQILSNLMSNATKFTHDGTITLQVTVGSLPRPSLNDTGQNTAAVVFSISDTGIGMNEEQIGRLFQPFTQADASTTRKYGGTGLGLAICKKLVTLMGGEISVSSVPQKGTTFTFHIPYRPCERPEAVATRDTEFSYDEYRAFAKGKSVLIVDDSKVNLKVADMMLQKLGYMTFTANDGQEAVDLVTTMNDKAVPVSAILMDIQMPNMDGYTATAVLRERGITLPIVAMTANALSGEREKCLAHGLNDYLTKPVHIITLANTLRRVLQAKNI